MNRYSLSDIIWAAIVLAFIVVGFLVVAGVDLSSAHHAVTHAVPAVHATGYGAHPPGAAPGVTYPPNIDLPKSSLIECSFNGCVTSVTP